MPLLSFHLVHARVSTKHLFSRKTWNSHALDGWYVGPSLEHYRCHKIYVNKTKQERNGDTVEFFPYNYNLPLPTTTDRITSAAKELTDALRQPSYPGPLPHIGENQHLALRQLAAVFERISTAMRHKQSLQPNRMLSKPNNTALPRVIKPNVNTPPIAPNVISPPRVQHTPIPIQNPNLISPP